MSLLTNPGVPIIRHRKAAYAGSPPPSGIFASEDWEARSNGSDPNNTDIQVGPGNWHDNFFTRVSTDQAKTGTKSLKFPFQGFAEEVCELWYDLAQNVTEIWIKYDLFIPTNYTIVDSNPGSDLALGGGDKEWVVFSDGYSTNYFTVILGRYFQRRDIDGGTAITPPTQVFQLGNISATNIAGTREYYTVPDFVAYSQECLLDINVDLGTWQRRILHLKMPTSAISNDGVCEYWNTKANGTTYKIIDVHDGPWYGANLNSTGGNYMNGGYMLGSCNSGFDEATNFYIDNVVWSTANEWGVS